MQSVTSLYAQDLEPGDVIHFGDDLCFVIGTENVETTDKGIESVTLVTEGMNGHQYVDYLNPLRQFTVVRTN